MDMIYWGVLTALIVVFAIGLIFGTGINLFPKQPAIIQETVICPTEISLTDSDRNLLISSSNPCGIGMFTLFNQVSQTDKNIPIYDIFCVKGGIYNGN